MISLLDLPVEKWKEVLDLLDKKRKLEQAHWSVGLLHLPREVRDVYGKRILRKLKKVERLLRLATQPPPPEWAKKEARYNDCMYCEFKPSCVVGCYVNKTQWKCAKYKNLEKSKDE